MTRTTSKPLLIIGLLVGVVALFMGTLENVNSLIGYLGMLLIAVWNRIDSRRRGYTFSLAGPGGSALKVVVPEQKTSPGR
jgi:hypothetical protein